MTSILISIKKMLGIAEEYTHFDADLIMHINSVFMILNQLGVGPPKCFVVVDEHDNWSDFIPEEQPNFEAVKTYMYLKVKMMFDPPLQSAVANAQTELIKELESRLNWNAELITESEEVDQNG